IKQVKVRLKDEVEKLETVKQELLSKKEEIVREIAVSEHRRDLYRRLNSLHQTVGVLTNKIRNALLEAGDKGLGLGGHLIHGAIIFNTSQDLVVKAISHIQEIHKVSKDLNIRFEPRL
ncbi:UNVERIFIED_CONTAM: hypothetical protein HDU68_003175, partial [Siphonaria sp. JEL0065]